MERFDSFSGLQDEVNLTYSYKNWIRASKETYVALFTDQAINITQGEKIAVWSYNRVEHKSTLCEQNVEFFSVRPEGL
jgi:hypothetical protein